MRLPWSRKQQQPQPETKTAAEYQADLDSFEPPVHVDARPRDLTAELAPKPQPTGKRFAWGPWETWLAENYPQHGAQWCAEELSQLAGREVPAKLVGQHARTLGLHVNPDVLRALKSHSIAAGRAAKAAKRGEPAAKKSAPKPAPIMAEPSPETPEPDPLDASLALTPKTFWSARDDKGCQVKLSELVDAKVTQTGKSRAWICLRLCAILHAEGLR